MSRPFALASDLHHHNWSAFSSTLPTGINSRLQIQLDELERAAKAVAEAGGCWVFGGGDLFHVRGAVAPSVLNPTRDRLRHCHKTYGTMFVFNAGNHDLEGKDSTRLGNAVAALESEFCYVISEPMLWSTGHSMAIIPWIESVEKLKAELERMAKAHAGKDTDLLIHAPVDGVIMGLPNHGITPAYLAGLGFRRVFSGHYHNHRDMGGGIYSIGATTHQTWSDVNSKPGFMIAYEGEVHYVASNAPRFCDLTEVKDETELLQNCDSNYVRVKVQSSKTAEIEQMRKLCEKAGARGVSIQFVKEPARARPVSAGGTTVSAGASLEVSVGEFVKGNIDPTLHADVTNAALKVLAEAA